MKKVEKIVDRMLGGVEKIARNEVKKVVLGDRAGCAAIWHQPRRPKKK